MATFLPVLTFHAIEENSSTMAFSPRVFARGMAMLHAHGYRTLTLLEAVDYLRGKRSFPENAFVLTFDDGYQTVYDEAYPVLQRYGMSATVFLTVGRKGAVKPDARLPSMEGRSMLAWREMQEMHCRGIDFGAHTLTHPDLTRLPVEQIKAEMCESKAVIEDALGTAVASFAYPYGQVNAESCAIAQQHFVCACSATLGLLTSGSPVFALERVDAYYLRTDRLFRLMLSKRFPWYIRARNLPRRARRAVKRRFP